MHLGQVVCGDALKLMPTLADRSLNLVLTSPPYAEQRKRQYGGVPEREYPAWTCRWMAALRPTLKDEGSVLIVIRSHVQNGVISDYVLRTRLALREDGWFELDELIWNKPDACFLGSKLRLRRAFENILWFSPTRKPYINLTANGSYSDRIGFTGSFRFHGKNSPIATKEPPKMKTGKSRGADVFTAYVAENENGIMHPAAAPVSLYEQLILTFSRAGSAILDPFAGSGSVLVAAKNIGDRRYIGIELKKEYAEIAARRLKTKLTEQGTVITPGQQVRLRTDFPDSPKSRRIYFQSRGLNASDADVFEFLLTKTVNSEERKAAVEVSQNEIVAATKVPRRTVIRALERLSNAELIKTVKDDEWYRGHPNRIEVASTLLVPIEVGT